MFSRMTIFILASLLHVSVNSVSIQEQAGYDRVIKCLKAANKNAHDFVTTVKVDPKHGITAVCRYDSALHSCLTEPLDSSSRCSSTDVLDFFRAFSLLFAFIHNQFNICPDLDTEHLKSLVVLSGVVERENLTNINEDPIAPCVGDAYRKCRKIDEELWENVWAQHVDVLVFWFIFIDCLEKEAKTCKGPMMEHIVYFTKVFKKYLWKNDALLARMMITTKNNEN